MFNLWFIETKLKEGTSGGTTFRNIYETTMVMPTYLLAFVISDYQITQVEGNIITFPFVKYERNNSMVKISFTMRI